VSVLNVGLKLLLNILLGRNSSASHGPILIFSGLFFCFSNMLSAWCLSRASRVRYSSISASTLHSSVQRRLDLFLAEQRRQTQQPHTAQGNSINVSWVGRSVDATAFVSTPGIRTSQIFMLHFSPFPS
jgi:hypothetical protein